MTEKEEHLLKNTVTEERAQVFHAVRRLGSKLSGLMITCGFIVFSLGIYLLLVPPDPTLSTRPQVIFIGALGFLGGLNILCGLLLLLGEE